MFNVYSNGQPAKFTTPSISFSNNSFATMQEAREYADVWVIPYDGCFDIYSWDGSPVTYSEDSNKIEIREEV